MPLRIPKNQIVFNYTAGKEYIVLSTKKEYQGHYYEINGKFFAGKEFNANAPEIIKSASVLFQSINPQTDIYNSLSKIDLSLPSITSIPFDGLEKIRYFIKNLFQSPSVIKEVNKDNFNSVKSNPTYQTVEVNFKYTMKEDELNSLNKQMPGIKSYLQDDLSPRTSSDETNPYINPFAKQLQQQANLLKSVIIKEEPTPITGSIVESPKSQDIIPVGPIILGTNLPLPVPPPALKLTWDDIANVPVADPFNVAQWNTFFGITSFPTRRFTSVTVMNGVVRLYGGTGIPVSSIFENNTHLTAFEDERNCIRQFSNTFTGCTNLITCIAPSVNSLAGNVFQNCTSLISIDFPIVTSLISSYDLFSYCTSLTSVNLPLVDFLENNTFYNCIKLTSVNLPNMYGMDSGIFESCTSLKTISLPNLDFMGSYCFVNCTSLISVDFPLATFIFNENFINCYSLTTINLPNLDVGNQGLGSSYDDDNLFTGIANNTINLTIPAGFLTCDGGNPDGDIQYLQAYNTVNIITT